MKGDVSVPTGIDGRRSRWDAHRTTRREELIDAAIRAIARRGADVGMDEIAADAQTSKPVIYRYFADKTELHRAVTQRVVGTILATLRIVMADRPDPRELIRGSVAGYLALLEQSPQLYRFVIRHPYLENGTTFSDVIAEMLAAELSVPLREAGLDPAYARPWGDAIVGFINAASLWWLDNPGGMTREQLADYLGTLLWGGAAGIHELSAPRAGTAPGRADNS